MIRNLLLDVEDGGMTSNAFLVTGERTVLIDAGSGFDAPAAIREHVDDIDALVLTHTHHDHIGNLEDLREAFGVDVWGFDPGHDAVDDELEAGDTVELGDDRYEILHTPGHKDDHVCLYAPDSGVLFAGDLVFANGGFGRTDLAEGDRDLLVESIQRLLERTDEITELHTGHGPSVTTNPRQDIELALHSAQMSA